MNTRHKCNTRQQRPLSNSRPVLAWRDLPHRINTAAYRVVNEAGESRVIYVSRNKRRILDGLIERPMYCANPCRLSHYVQLMREEQNLGIDTEWFSDDPATGRERYGIYVLRDTVTRIDQQEDAA